MAHSDAVRQILEDGDIPRFRQAWSVAFPALPIPATDAELEPVLHHARTKAVSVAFAKRAYSHRWLTDRALPSGLPDKLKSKAERLYPRVARAVGTGSRSNIPGLAPLIAKAMSNAVADCYANGDTGTEVVRSRIQWARKQTVISLMGAAYGRSA